TVRQANETLYEICMANPFTHAVELVRFAMYEKFNVVSFAVVAGSLVIFMVLAIVGYDPGRGLIVRKAGTE
ncbi:MAG: ABC transporter permease, partial [Steroidobacteraceae bacterium]